MWVAVILWWVADWLGLFCTVKLVDDTFGPCTLVGLPHIGPFSGVGSTFAKFCDPLLPPASWTLGIYYGRPQKVQKEKCRALCCCAYKPEELKAEQKERLKEKYVVIDVPECKCKTWLFPYRNSLSFMIGAMKLYPAVRDVKDVCWVRNEWWRILMALVHRWVFLRGPDCIRGLSSTARGARAAAASGTSGLPTTTKSWTRAMCSRRSERGSASLGCFIGAESAGS